MSVRWKDKPQLISLAGTERLAATSIAGGSKVGGGSVSADGDIFITPDQLKAWLARNEFVNVALSDMTTALTTGDGKAQWFAPEDGTLVGVFIGVDTVSSSGSVTIDMRDSGGTVFTTQPVIDVSEATSLTGSAAVIDSPVTFSKGDKFLFDIDAAGIGAKGLQAVVEYTPA